MLLKVLHKPPRPIRVYMPKLGEINKARGIMKLNQGGISRVEPYGITWSLMLLKVLHKTPRPIRAYMPKLREIIKDGGIMELNQGGFSRVQYLMGLHGHLCLDYMEVNAIESLI
jgi:hypothetical protein